MWYEMTWGVADLGSQEHQMRSCAKQGTENRPGSKPGADLHRRKPLDGIRVALDELDQQDGLGIGATVEIGGKPYVMAMVVREDENRHRLYVHEVVLREKLQAAFKTAASAGDQAPVELHGAKPGVVSADAAPRKTIRARETVSTRSKRWKWERRAPCQKWWTLTEPKAPDFSPAPRDSQIL